MSKVARHEDNKIEGMSSFPSIVSFENYSMRYYLSAQRLESKFDLHSDTKARTSLSGDEDSINSLVVSASLIL